jgi:hypothetical protein
MEASTVSIEFTPAERERIEERQRKTQVAFERMATASLEAQQRIGDKLWAETIERPRAARRIETARRVAPAVSRPTRAGRVTVKRRARAARTATPIRGDPDDDPPPLRSIREVLEAHPIYRVFFPLDLRKEVSS